MTEKKLSKFAGKLVRFEMQLFKHSVESKLITGVVSISPTKSVVVRDGRYHEKDHLDFYLDYVDRYTLIEWNQVKLIRDNTFEVWDDSEWRFVFK